jgi:hypothetical protein
MNDPTRNIVFDFDCTLTTMHLSNHMNCTSKNDFLCKKINQCLKLDGDTLIMTINTNDIDKNNIIKLLFGSNERHFSLITLLNTFKQNKVNMYISSYANLFHIIWALYMGGLYHYFDMINAVILDPLGKIKSNGGNGYNYKIIVDQLNIADPSKYINIYNSKYPFISKIISKGITYYVDDNPDLDILASSKYKYTCFANGLTLLNMGYKLKKITNMVIDILCTCELNFQNNNYIGCDNCYICTNEKCYNTANNCCMRNLNCYSKKNCKYIFEKYTSRAAEQDPSLYNNISNMNIYGIDDKIKIVHIDLPIDNTGLSISNNNVISKTIIDDIADYNKKNNINIDTLSDTTIDNDTKNKQKNALHKYLKYKKKYSNLKKY